MTFKHPTKGRELRSGRGIVGYVGPNGSGKTTAMAWDTIPTLESGRQVLSTVRLLDYTNPRLCEQDGCGFTAKRGTYIPGTSCDKTDPDRHMQAHPLWVPFTDWWQLADWGDGDILMDEVSGVASSRDHHAMPSEVATLLQQLRKDDCVTRWTAPAWGRADTIIRSVTNVVVACRGHFPTESSDLLNGRVRRWRSNRFFNWKMFDANEFEDFTNEKREKLKPMGRDRHVGAGSPAFLLFDTYAHALTVGAVTSTGRCMICGGSRRAKPCPGHDGDDPVSLRRKAAGPRSRGAAPASDAGSPSSMPEQDGPDVGPSGGSASETPERAA